MELYMQAAEQGHAMVQSSLGNMYFEGRGVEVIAGDTGARFLLVAARPLNEPIARYGPFVMNTHQQIEQAINDFNSGLF